MWKCINLTAAKSVWSFWTSVAETGRNDHILFAFSAICINNILNETAAFKSGTSSTVILIQQSYLTYKCKKGQNDCHGLSSVNVTSFTFFFPVIAEMC